MTMTPILAGYIEAKQIAERLGLTAHTIQRYLANPGHQQFIPNVKIGRKRFVKTEDFEQWFDRLKGI